MVNHSNPNWTGRETDVLLENYRTKEMHELEEVMALCYFPRPPEGIKRRLEKLLAAGMLLDRKRIKHLRKRKLWRKSAHSKFLAQLHLWRKNNQSYFKTWFKEHPGYFKNWIEAHPEYFRMARKRFIKNHPDYGRKYHTLLREHIDGLLPQIFGGNPELPKEEIITGIHDLTGIKLKEGTLENILGKYESNPRGLPVIKAGSENYRLNESFYKS